MSEFADQQLADFMATYNATDPPRAADLGAEALRAAAAERTASRPRGPELANVRDVVVPATGVGARLYRPTTAATGIVLYLHGGGWVFGDLETHDRACRRLADTAGVAVLAVDYRRAPEHPWPAAVDDAVAALRWVDAQPTELGPFTGDVAVAGDSAGGTIGALACLRLLDEGGTNLPGLLVMLYANTDLASSGGSMDAQGHGYGLDRDDVAWFNAQWVPDRQMWTDGRVSPLHTAVLTGLPPTLIITCEHDPLRDQGEAFADRLGKAGVTVTMRREPGMVHNFMLWDLVSPACKAAADRVGADIAARLRLSESAGDAAERFEDFIRHRPDVGQAYVNGDAWPLTRISTEHDPATFFGPQGGIVEGADLVLATNQRGAASFISGGKSRFEILHAAASGDLGYLVGIQRATVRLAATDAEIDMALRLTELYRREHGTWKLVHRHADPHEGPRR